MKTIFLAFFLAAPGASAFWLDQLCANGQNCSEICEYDLAGSDNVRVKTVARKTTDGFTTRVMLNGAKIGRMDELANFDHSGVLQTYHLSHRHGSAGRDESKWARTDFAATDSGLAGVTQILKSSADSRNGADKSPLHREFFTLFWASDDFERDWSRGDFASRWLDLFAHHAPVVRDDMSVTIAGNKATPSITANFLGLRFIDENELAVFNNSKNGQEPNTLVVRVTRQAAGNNQKVNANISFAGAKGTILSETNPRSGKPFQSYQLKVQAGIASVNLELRNLATANCRRQ